VRRFPAVIALIAALLMLQLRRLSATLMVMITAPLGVIGVAGALLLFNQPFGFVAMLGAIALSGMIMRNTVILVDQIRQEREDGQPVRIAIRELYGVDELSAGTIQTVQAGYEKVRKPGFYKYVLTECGGIESCQVNSLGEPFRKTSMPSDPFTNGVASTVFVFSFAWLPNSGRRVSVPLP